MIFDQYINKINEKPVTSKFNVEVKPPHVENDECWDNIRVESYDPKRHVEEIPVIRVCNGMTLAERREFRANESERINKLVDKE